MINNGGRIGPKNSPTTSDASGVWSLFEQATAKRGGAWPAVTTAPTSIEYLVVAGGGGGGDVHGGGGGAGGYLSGTQSVVGASAYTITIGAGGLGGNYETNNTTAQGSGGRGVDSSFVNSGQSVSIVSNGGGGGVSFFGYSTGTNRGSGGGGAGGANNSGESGTSGQGNSGGTGGGGVNGGGGGGAGAVGGSVSGDLGGEGGIGSVWLDGNRYAGGGGGAWGTETSGGGNGGGGGGGNGGWNDNNTAGAANSGGGGGGTRSFDLTSPGKNGGSGVVIVRYPDTFSPADATTGSPTITVTGGYRYYKFTGSGSITF